ncbi:Copper-exporting P-type ATPase A [Rothia dentocariosa]|uniref:Copper-exporting P-type ATPase A n=1 Tax=Rothia dentocariosa TaxID=2047 RepID=A0A448UXD9_9MICC|nr:Copper-exporting P-type ATPase A [Rothia dentocariosa]
MGNSTQTASTTTENERSLFDSSANGGQTRIIHLDVQGMTCASCVGRVERKLRKIPGVDPAVNLPLESARVIVPADITDEQIIETVNNAGYTASLKTEVRDAVSEETTNAHSGGLGGASLWRCC